MANNYFEFSEIIENITGEEAKWINGIPEPSDCDAEEDWEAQYEAALREHGIDPTDLGDLDMFPAFYSVVNEDDHIWGVYADAGGDLNHLASTMEGFIKKFRPDMVFKLTWSESCDKLRPGEFGGGYMVVSKDRTEMKNVWELAEERASALKTRRELP